MRQNKEGLLRRANYAVRLREIRSSRPDAVLSTVAGEVVSGKAIEAKIDLMDTPRPAETDPSGLVEWQDSSRPFERRRTMVHPQKNNKPVSSSIDSASHTGSANSLLPMLIGGLVLIVIGAIIVMTFV